MKKVLVVLLALAALLGMLTTASISSQRMAWKNEAEKNKRALEELEDEYAAYCKETDARIAALETERDAYSLLNQAIEAENARLQAQMDSMNQSLAAASGLEAQLTQANAERAWAESRLQEALDVLLTPSPAPSATPMPSAGPLSLLPALDWAPITDSVRGLRIFSLPMDEILHAEESATPSYAPTAVPSPSPSPAEDAAQQ